MCLASHKWERKQGTDVPGDEQSSHSSMEVSGRPLPVNSLCVGRTVRARREMSENVPKTHKYTYTCVHVEYNSILLRLVLQNVTTRELACEARPLPARGRPRCSPVPSRRRQRRRAYS